MSKYFAIRNTAYQKIAKRSIKQKPSQANWQVFKTYSIHGIQRVHRNIREPLQWSIEHSKTMTKSLYKNMPYSISFPSYSHFLNSSNAQSLGFPGSVQNGHFRFENKPADVVFFNLSSICRIDW